MQELGRQSLQAKHIATSTQASIVEIFRKYKRPSFNGEYDPLATEEWLWKLRWIFELIDANDAQKIQCTKYMSMGAASHLWKSKYRTRIKAQQEALTWNQFKEKVTEKFFSQTLRDFKETEFLQPKQGSLPLIDYEKKLDQLNRYTPHLVDTEAKKIKRSYQELHQDISMMLMSHRFTIYSEMLEWAHTFWYQRAINEKYGIKTSADHHG